MKIRMVIVRKTHYCDQIYFLKGSQCDSEVKKGQRAVLIEYNRTENTRDYDPRATQRFRLHLSCYRQLTSIIPKWPALEELGLTG
jgi:hypothetical protein